MTTILRFSFLIALFSTCTFLSAQNQYFTRTAHLHLKTTNRLSDIEADNYQVFAQIDIVSGKIDFSCLIKSFEFQLGIANRIMDSKALNVSEFPKATYSGQITNLESIIFAKPGNYSAKIEGDLFVWDEKRRTKADVLITVRPDNTIYAKSNFHHDHRREKYGKSE